MKDRLFELRRERLELTGKIKRLEEFRGTEDWNKLTLSHKQLLDVQLSVMKSYLEILISRCVDLMSTPDNTEDKEESTKIFTINVKVIDDEE